MLSAVKMIELLKIQDGGRPPFTKQVNRYISATVRPIAAKFGTMIDINPVYPIER